MNWIPSFEKGGWPSVSYDDIAKQARSVTASTHEGLRLWAPASAPVLAKIARFAAATGIRGIKGACGYEPNPGELGRRGSISGAWKCVKVCSTKAIEPKHEREESESRAFEMNRTLNGLQGVRSEKCYRGKGKV